MRILRISYEWPPPWIGLPPHIYEVTAHQAKKGNFIDVFCGRWLKSGPVEQLNNVRVHTFIRELFPASLLFTISPIVLIYYLMWRVFNKPDIIHMHGHFGYWILKYRKLLKKVYKHSSENSIPLVAHFHNNAKARWDKLVEKGSPLKWYTEKIVFPMEVKANKLAIELADAYIFVGQDVMDASIKEYNADPSKCFVVESGVNTNLFCSVDSIEKDKTRSELGLIFADKVILNAGFIKERKNIHLLVEALTYLPVEYKLVLMGDGDDKYIEKINKYITEHHLEQRVLRIGVTPYREVPYAMQISNIFVLPSFWEGTSKAIIESLSCGVPVLYSGSRLKDDLPGLFYLTEISPQAIANQIKTIVESDPYVDVNRIRSLFSWDRKVEEIEKVYNYVFENYRNNKK